MRERIARAALAAATIAALFAAPAAQAGLKLFTAQWYTESFGNECQGTMTPGGLPAPHCSVATGEFAQYSIFAMPQGILCNATQPRCAFSSTPTDGKGNFHPLGGPGNPTMPTSIHCTPLSQYGAGITVRPAKGETASPRVPPLYRNPFFFTSGGQPKHTDCTARSTGYATGTQTRFGADKGKVQLGNPVTGTWQATTTAAGGFSIPPAPLQHEAGVRTGQGTRRWTHWGGWQESGRSGRVGEFANFYPYIYSYTYATLRNDAGAFGPGQGPGSFVYNYPKGATTYVAGITVKQGPAKFGGTMKMLGVLSTKVCYWLQAGGGNCSIQSPNWLYEHVGAGAQTSGGAVTMGITVNWPGTSYYCTWTCPSYQIVGSRFPWTTGSVTVTAVGRGPHRTVHYARGYDNRTPTHGSGTIQLVSPLLTRWLGFADFETGGIGVLRIQFIPEARAWAMFATGMALLCALRRSR